MEILKKIKTLGMVGVLVGLSSNVYAEDPDQVCTSATVYNLYGCTYNAGSTSTTRDFLLQSTPSAPSFISAFGDTLYLQQGSCIVTTDEVEACNNKPDANFIVQEENKWSGGTNRVSLISTSNDDDGDEVSYEWWVDGQKQASTNYHIYIYTHLPKTVTIKLKASDGELADIETRTVSLSGYDDNCRHCQID